MSEATEQIESTVVTTIRQNVKENIRIARLKNRQDELDSSRSISLDDLKDQTVNLQTFTTKDVYDIIEKIKKQRHASEAELLKLSHAFLQSVENIDCFVNRTGAVQVIVKEMTGTKIETQMLAMECLCNMSLGPEISCEKIAQLIGTYLHTFLQSSNETLARTSLWCLTNLIAAGQKPLKILSSQELIKGLINANVSSHNQNVKDESYVAIELILDHGGVPKPSDIETLSKWILDHATPLNCPITRIAYKLLTLLEFRSNDAICIRKLVHNCFDTLIHIQESSTTNTSEQLHQAVLLMRICANIIALENSYADYIIENWFGTKNNNRSMALLFNHFINQFVANSLNIKEICWFIGNIDKFKHGEVATNIVQTEQFMENVKMNTIYDI